MGNSGFAEEFLSRHTSGMSENPDIRVYHAGTMLRGRTDAVNIKRQSPDVWRTEHPLHLYCGRRVAIRSGRFKGEVWPQSPLCNPHGLRDRMASVLAFAESMLWLSAPERLWRLRLAKGRILGCWCAPKLCHCHVIAAWCNELIDDSGFAADEDDPRWHLIPYQLVTNSPTV